MNTVARISPDKLGKYLIVREIGRGGMGVVYEGYDPIIERRVALKTLISELFTGPDSQEFLSRLRREAQAAGRLSHRHIVAVYDFGEDVVTGGDGAEVRTAFIAMEFIEGRELKSFFDANERFPINTVTRIMCELLDALEYSHGRGVVHRDIKPANIILLADGTVKVADFGIARIESSTLTQVGTVLGSPSYMSPEQFIGQTVDGRSDLYSAAIVLYELLTGEVPFSGSFSSIMHRVLNENASPPSALNLTAPMAFDGLIRRAMAKRPDERFQTAAEFKQAILEAGAGAATGAGSKTQGTDSRHGIGKTELRTPATGSAPPARTSRLRAGLLVAAVCVATVAAAGYFWWGPHPTQRGPDAANGAAEGKSAPAASGPAAIAGTSPSAGANSTPGGSRATVAASAGPAAPASHAAAAPPSGMVVVSAVGVADPNDPQAAKQTAAIDRLVWGDARRQLVTKAMALYVEPKSIEANYALLRTRLLEHSDDYISQVLETSQPQVSQYGLMVGTMRAAVKVRDVQKALNQLSREDRVEFVRNGAFPRIAVSIAVQSAEDGPPGPPERSAVAENLLKERIRSFGFPIVDQQSANAKADFEVNGEVRFKKLSARLAASGLTIEKFVLTSWTLRAVDTQSGEEIYHDTTIPEKKSWATEALALQEIGRLIGEKFSKTFFLEYFDFGTRRVRLRFGGLAATTVNAVLPEINTSLRFLNVAAVQQQGNDFVIDTDVSGAVAAGDLVQESLLGPLNRRLGKICFTVTNADSTDVTVLFEASCSSAETLKRLDAPPDGLTRAPARRIEDVVKDPNALRRTTI